MTYHDNHILLWMEVNITYVIMYHYVRKLCGSQYPGIKGLELRYFKEQLSFLQQNGFQFVTLNDIIQGRTLLEKSVLLTFDDGYIDHYSKVFPILEQNGIQGVFSMPGKIIREKKVLDVNKIHFILAVADVQVIKKRLYAKMDAYRGTEFAYPSNEELYEKLAVTDRFDDKDTIFVKRALQAELPETLRNRISDELFREFVTDQESAFVDELYMNMDQIQTMQRHGMVFGIHGYDHYWMNRLSERALRADLTQALDVFDGIIDPANWTNCYPYGSYNSDVIRVSKELGAVSGLCTRVAPYLPGRDSIFEIPRLDTNDFPPKSEKYLEMGV